VRREGVFVLRYRMFDLFSAAAGERASTLAELYGGPFKVYSTRDFPGLEPSTDLTKVLSCFSYLVLRHSCDDIFQILSKYGVRVTLRDAERKSKKRSRSDESS